ncbi:hypothetical protein E2C01_046402 [Portunus trituberculatus]|uniref:Uncharacterized protein n=1 Tax=Portunus trituberculatus TaxID=210409 RepID=A0A5B7FYC8_PORTR|nr:hypothetical protein [Portunus trituberculatus]
MRIGAIGHTIKKKPQRSRSLEDTSRWIYNQTGHRSKEFQDPKGAVEARNAAGRSINWGPCMCGQDEWVLRSASGGYRLREDSRESGLANLSSMPEAAQQLCGVAGQCVSLWDPFLVNIGMVVVLQRLSVFVAALEDPCLMGIDFLNRVGASLDFREGKLKVHGHEVPLILGGDAQCERSRQQG